MKKFLTASKDTTLYEAFPTINVGLDEILEIGKVIDTNVDFTSSTVYSTCVPPSFVCTELTKLTFWKPFSDLAKPIFQSRVSSKKYSLA